MNPSKADFNKGESLDLFKKIIYKINHKAAFYLGKINISIPSNEIFVSFTFDDFSSSAVENGARLLENHSMKGTFYASLGLMDAQPEEDKLFSKTQLLGLCRNGHEIGCHTYDHYNCLYTQADLIRKSCLKNKKELEDLIDSQVCSFAYPYGDFSLSNKRTVGNIYQSSRSIKAGLNQSHMDLMALKAVALYQKRSEESIFNWFEKLNQSGGWLIYYTHDVKNNPSEFGCTPELFQKVLDECIERNFPVMSVKDVLKKIQRYNSFF